MHFTHARKLLVVCTFLPVATDAFAADVLQIARSYENGGGYNSQWKGTGVPEEIRFKDDLILKQGDGTYCCGFTFVVAIEAANDRRLLADKSVSEVRKFHAIGMAPPRRVTKRSASTPSNNWGLVVRYPWKKHSRATSFSSGEQASPATASSFWTGLKTRIASSA